MFTALVTVLINLVLLAYGNDVCECLMEDLNACVVDCSILNVDIERIGQVAVVSFRASNQSRIIRSLTEKV